MYVSLVKKIYFHKKGDATDFYFFQGELVACLCVLTVNVYHFLSLNLKSLHIWCMKKSQRQLFVVKKCKISKELIPQVWIYFVTWKKRKSSLFVYQVNFKMSRFQMKIVTCDLKILIFFSWHLLHFTSLYLALASPTYEGEYHLQQILSYTSRYLLSFV